MSYNFDEVLTMFDRAKAKRPQRWAGTDVYGFAQALAPNDPRFAGVADDNWIQKGSRALDSVIESTGLPDASADFFGGLAGLVGQEEIGRDVGRMIPRGLVDTLPLAIPGVGIPISAALSGASAYADTDNVAAGLIGAAAPGATMKLMRPAERLALSIGKKYGLKTGIDEAGMLAADGLLARTVGYGGGQAAALGVEGVADQATSVVQGQGMFNPLTPEYLTAQAIGNVPFMVLDAPALIKQTNLVAQNKSTRNKAKVPKNVIDPEPEFTRKETVKGKTVVNEIVSITQELAKLKTGEITPEVQARIDILNTRLNKVIDSKTPSEGDASPTDPTFGDEGAPPVESTVPPADLVQEESKTPTEVPPEVVAKEPEVAPEKEARSRVAANKVIERKDKKGHTWTLLEITSGPEEGRGKEIWVANDKLSFDKENSAYSFPTRFMDNVATERVVPETKAETQAEDPLFTAETIAKVSANNVAAAITKTREGNGILKFAAIDAETLRNSIYTLVSEGESSVQAVNKTVNKVGNSAVEVAKTQKILKAGAKEKVSKKEANRLKRQKELNDLVASLPREEQDIVGDLLVLMANQGDQQGFNTTEVDFRTQGAVLKFIRKGGNIKLQLQKLKDSMGSSKQLARLADREPDVKTYFGKDGKWQALTGAKGLGEMYATRKEAEAQASHLAEVDQVKNRGKSVSYVAKKSGKAKGGKNWRVEKHEWHGKVEFVEGQTERFADDNSYRGENEKVTEDTGTAEIYDSVSSDDGIDSWKPKMIDSLETNAKSLKNLSPEELLAMNDGEVLNMDRYLKELNDLFKDLRDGKEDVKNLHRILADRDLDNPMTFQLFATFAQSITDGTYVGSDGRLYAQKPQLSQEIPVGTAFRMDDGTVISAEGKQHFEMLDQVEAAGYNPDKLKNENFGFVSNTGRFLSRAEASALNKQKITNTHAVDVIAANEARARGEKFLPGEVVLYKGEIGGHEEATFLSQDGEAAYVKTSDGNVRVPLTRLINKNQLGGLHVGDDGRLYAGSSEANTQGLMTLVSDQGDMIYASKNALATASEAGILPSGEKIARKIFEGQGRHPDEVEGFMGIIRKLLALVPILENTGIRELFVNRTKMSPDVNVTHATIKQFTPSNKDIVTSDSSFTTGGENYDQVTWTHKPTGSVMKANIFMGPVTGKATHITINRIDTPSASQRKGGALEHVKALQEFAQQTGLPIYSGQTNKMSKSLMKKAGFRDSQTPWDVPLAERQGRSFPEEFADQVWEPMSQSTLMGLSDQSKASILLRGDIKNPITAIGVLAHELGHQIDAGHNQRKMSVEWQQRYDLARNFFDNLDEQGRGYVMKLVKETLPPEYFKGSELGALLERGVKNTDELMANVTGMSMLAASQKPHLWRSVVEMLPKPIADWLTHVVDIAKTSMGALKSLAGIGVQELGGFKSELAMRKQLRDFESTLNKMYRDNRAVERTVQKFLALDQLSTSGYGHLQGTVEDPMTVMDLSSPELRAAEVVAGGILFGKRSQVIEDTLNNLKWTAGNWFTKFEEWAMPLRHHMEEYPQGREGFMITNRQQRYEQETRLKFMQLLAMSPNEEGGFSSDPEMKTFQHTLDSPKLQKTLSDIARKRQYDGEKYDVKYEERLLKKMSAKDRKSAQHFLDFMEYSTSVAKDEDIATRQTVVKMVGAQIVLMKNRKLSAKKAQEVADHMWNAVESQDPVAIQAAQQLLGADVMLDLYGFYKKSMASIKQVREFFDSKKYFVTERREGDFGVRFRYTNGTSDFAAATDYAGQLNIVKRLTADPKVDTASIVQQDPKKYGEFGNYEEDFVKQLREYDEKMRENVLSLIPDEETRAKVEPYLSVTDELVKDIANQTVIVNENSPKREFKDERHNLNMVLNHMNYLKALTKQMSRRRANGEMGVQMLDKAVTDNPTVPRLIKKAFENYQKPDTKVGQVLSSGNFLMFLGFNISNHIMEGAQWLVSLPSVLTELNPEAGVVASYISTLRAAKEVTNFFRTKKWSSPELQALMDDTALDVDHSLGSLSNHISNDSLSLVQSLRLGQGNSIIGKHDLYGNPLALYSNAAKALYQIPSKFNSRVAIVAGYQTGRARGLSHIEAIGEARRVNGLANFNEGKSGRPLGPYDNKTGLGRTAANMYMSLQGYSLGMMSMFLRQAKTAFSGRTDIPVAQRRAARKALVQLASTQFALAGTMGLPFVGAISALIEQMFPEVEVEKNSREWVAKLAGQDADFAHCSRRVD